ncbi:phage tail protein [Phyllobacterium lublinensis]|uniref:phage tail protein n=1 Tax=Phyllobacterium lublinensis TaxID=2875708 RepID=UPI001CCB6BF8|nr:phage tail protein [Phyllobacterium sp. 2063]MBZ9653554.1 phage tail protein [Phyllobacterium sp. 2063]
MAVFTGLASAIGGLLGGTFLSGGLSAALLKAVVGIGLSYAAQALAGKKPEAARFSVNGTVQSGGDVARSIILGHTTTAGSLVYANSWGESNKTPNAYFTQVIALSDVPITGITQLWVNGEPVTINTADSSYIMGYPITQYATSKGNHLWIRFHDGTQTTADPFLTGTVSSGTHPWEATRVGHGVAYAIVTSQINQELFTGFPQFKFEVQGARLYDPSRDTSVGGAGSQRFDNPATWGGDGDDLPAVQIYNLLRGITYANTWLYGLQGLAVARVPAADWIAQINKCRADIAGPSGPEPTYYTGGEIEVGAQIAEAIEAILTGCQGKLSEAGGVYKVRVGSPSSAVFAFSDADILSTEEQEFTPFFGLADTINGISATYPEPAEAWNTKTAPALYNTTYEAQDGNRRLMADVQMDMVYRASQVQRLMKSALAEARRARRHTLVLGPAAWPLEPGDVIVWNSTRNGYEDKLFRVDGVADRGNLDVMIDITEVDPSDYDWDQETDYTPPIFGPVGPVRPQPQPIVDWAADPAVVLDNNGSPRRPAILLTWDGAQPDVIGVEFEVRLASSLVTVYQGSTRQPTVGSIIISQGLLPNTLYGVRGRYIPGTPRPVEWSAWLNVTTPNVLLGSEDIYVDDIVDEVNEQIGEHLEWIGESTHWPRDELERLNALAANAGAQSALDKYEILKEVGNVSAKYSREIRVVATATEAAVIRIEELTVKVDTDIANAIDSLSASIAIVDGKAEANADAITALNVSVGNFSASGLFRVSVTATESGALSTIGLSAAATGGGTTTSAALFLSAKTGGISTVTILADRFVISNGTTPEFPFIFQSGVLTMNATRVNTITAGMLRSSDSKMQVDLTNRRILIAD